MPFDLADGRISDGIRRNLEMSYYFSQESGAICTALSGKPFSKAERMEVCCIMKKAWETPRIVIQKFEPNEYVAACYTLVCAIPGWSATEIGDGTTTRWFTKSRTWDGSYVQADGLAHGNCGNESTSYDVDNSIGYEHNNDGTVKNAVISNVNIGSHVSGNTYYATWQSNNGTLYTHYGYALLDANKPNHS